MSNHPLVRRRDARSALSALLEVEDLGTHLQRIAPADFTRLVSSIGLEDVGEILALATTEQLVAAADELLFSRQTAGEAERFSPTNFLTWLEVLSEAGAEEAAQRLLSMGEEFAAFAMASVLWVVDDESLAHRLSRAEYLGDAFDKALDSCPYEQVDGYLLVAKSESGWEALLNLVLALDQLERDSLVRLLDRCADLQSEEVEDLERFTALLSRESALAEDVEAEREARRGQLGYVEPRAAKAFLRGCIQERAIERDPLTKRYFSRLAFNLPSVVRPGALPKGDAELASTSEQTVETDAPREVQISEHFARVFGTLQLVDSALASMRLEEMTYLVNVLVAGADNHGEQLGIAEASHAVLCTVAYGAQLEIDEHGLPFEQRLRGALENTSADVLFRRAAFTLVQSGLAPSDRPWLSDELSLYGESQST